ncbi:thiol reductant ABC exporter subunit CydD [Paraoerskovia marina]|uniref:thiol reductant ABC exporter subunit CydD n=1 Tax=Paraoerskovia marina TaxID=545619 RepID=UPI0004923808|nr:thiol reductant ABC exporter subunit CydD [Paraoerskovia marina]
MKPLDPRLLRHARAARGYVVLTAVFGVLTAALVVAQALLIAAVLAPAIQGDLTTLGAAGTSVGLLVLVVALRSAASWAQERFAVRAAARTIAELRESVVAHAVRLGPRRLAGGEGADVATLTTRGLDALEPYFVRYLPQLLLAVTVTPATLLVVLGLDWVSAAVIAGTIPLVPIFMILVGQMTAGTSERRLVVVQQLGNQVLDLLTGLPTLRAYGRERGPRARVRALGDANRRATMGTLRIAFLSGMVLELLTTLAVALVAVGIGLRLVHGDGITLEAGLAVLILAPEVYLPLRQVGAQFHASTDGLAAADRAFAVLDEPVPPRGTTPAPDLRGAIIRFDGLTVRAGDRATDAPAGLDAQVTCDGRVVALVGPSGSGKSTTALTMLGLLPADAGAVTVTGAGSDGPVDVSDLEPESWWRQITWLPQRPLVGPGTILDIARGATDASDDDVAEAACATGLDAVVRDLPDGWTSAVGRAGAGLSVGQRQRLALTAALLDRSTPLVVLDEPTAHLDARGEEGVLAALATLREQGRTVVVIAHRTAVVALADDVVHVSAKAHA